MTTPITPAGFIALLFVALQERRINFEAYRLIIDTFASKGLQAAIDAARKYGLCGGAK